MRKAARGRIKSRTRVSERRDGVIAPSRVRFFSKEDMMLLFALCPVQDLPVSIVLITSSGQSKPLQCIQGRVTAPKHASGWRYILQTGRSVRCMILVGLVDLRKAVVKSNRGPRCARTTRSCMTPTSPKPRLKSLCANFRYNAPSSNDRTSLDIIVLVLGMVDMDVAVARALSLQGLGIGNV